MIPNMEFTLQLLKTPIPHGYRWESLSKVNTQISNNHPGPNIYGDLIYSIVAKYNNPTWISVEVPLQSEYSYI